jgi:ferredoxin-type protein NapG
MCADVPCVPVCPTGALRDVEEPEQIKMGYAVILEDLCIAYAGMRCEVCYRACPLIDQAITIDYREREDDAIHLIFAPVIHDDICTGCGWCVERCVTDTPSIAIVRTLEEAEAMREEHRNMEKVRNY